MLKHLEIQGFKSFADKTKLRFSPGITCIVGPNGCGKSNIADAFRWVFGEQSAKSMRGNKMPDVIFAGTQQRKPLNFAEVTIHLENEDQRFASGFNEIAVTRRLHRSGESEYFINKTAVRLRDVQDLFLDSGVGKSAFSIFEQGKIDQIIYYSQLERRYIFEEAAGILRFLQRKREALKKLEQADLNISRAKDIHHEVEKQITLLEQQAHDARLYKENKQQLEKMEKAVLFHRHRNALEKKHILAQKLAELRSKITQDEKTLEHHQEQLIVQKERVKQSQSALNTLTETIYQIRSDKEIRTREHQSRLDRIKEADHKEKLWQQEIEFLNKQKANRQQERQTIQGEQSTHQTSMTLLEKNVHAQLEKVKQLEQELTQQREQQQRLHHEMLKQLQEESRLESEYKQVSVRLETSHERLKGIGEKQKQLEASIETHRTLIRERQEAAQELATAIEKQKKVLAETDGQLQKVGIKIQGAETSIESLKQKKHECSAKEKILVSLKNEMEGFSQGAKSVIKESKNTKSPLYGIVSTLAEHLALAQADIAAFSPLLRPYTQTLLVASFDEFHSVLTYLDEKKIKDVSIFCLECIVPAGSLSHKQTATSLFTHFTADAKHVTQEVLISHLRNSDLDQPLLDAQGAMVDHKQVFFGASCGGTQAFVREAELNTLKGQLKETEEILTIRQKEIEAFKEEKQRLSNEQNEIDKSLRRNELKHVESSFLLQKSQNEIERCQQELSQLHQEITTLQQSSEALTQQQQTLHTTVSTIKDTSKQAQKNAQTASNAIDQQMQEIKKERVTLAEAEKKLQQLHESMHKLAHQQKVLDLNDQEATNQISRLQTEIASSQKMRASFQEQGDAAQTTIASIAENLMATEQKSQALSQEILEQQKNVDSVEQSTQSTSKKIHESKQEAQQVDMTCSQLDTIMETSINELQELYTLTIDEAAPLAAAFVEPIEIQEKKVRQMRQSLDHADHINLTAIEEFEKHQTRYEYLNQQIDDLEITRKELIEIIAQLDEQSRKIFKETFETIRSNFKKNFAILFNGGEADLEFTDSSDVLEAGIDIIAKPPGKQMRSIMLLSGGEKCMTAMALLFAIFEVKPAPFCILDEIDAPLDDTNVERFLNVVKQFINRCQFIIITHNKKTMAMADMLFGVSMEEKGVSKLLKMEFEEAEPALALL